uniref:Uncharacterized protein n=1 Tax=Knipowitschia caucasica TaxID=637954 RepID=A0AAV2K3C0_KNICA
MGAFAELRATAALRTAPVSAESSPRYELRVEARSSQRGPPAGSSDTHAITATTQGDTAGTCDLNIQAQLHHRAQSRCGREPETGLSERLNMHSGEGSSV